MYPFPCDTDTHDRPKLTNSYWNLLHNGTGVGNGIVRKIAYGVKTEVRVKLLSMLYEEPGQDFLLEKGESDLAEKLLEWADRLIEQEERSDELLDLLKKAEKAASDDLNVLCHSSEILLKYGLLHGKNHFFLLAHEKMAQVKRKNAFFLESHPLWLHHWGSVLVQLGKLANDSHLLSKAIKKYQNAESIFQKNGATIDAKLHWDLARAWFFLAKISKEPSDFEQALSNFYKVKTEAALSIFFRLDYGNALLEYGLLVGSFHLIEKAITHFRHAIHDSSYPHQPPTIAYIIAWRQLALSLKAAFFLTHRIDYLHEADRAFRDAILASERNGYLWLDWGELYLHGGWVCRDLKLIQLGLEKLTASKIKECDPYRVAALLSRGLVLKGYFLESSQLIQNGRERIKRALEMAPDNSHLSDAAEVSLLISALYLSDQNLFLQAIICFENRVRENPFSADSLHGLFQIYSAFGLQKKDKHLLTKGIELISRLCTLRPESHIHLNEWGLALLRLRPFQNDRTLQLVYLEEAIDKFSKAAEFGDDAETLYNWGCAFDILGEMTKKREHFQSAIHLLLQALEMNDHQLPTRYHLARAYFHLGKLLLNSDYLIKAIALFELGVKFDTEDDRLWLDLGHAQLHLGEIWTKKGQIDKGIDFRKKAEKSFMEAAKLGNERVYYPLACLYSLSGLYPRAMEFLIKAEKSHLLPKKNDLEQENWLAGVRQTEHFRNFFTNLSEVENRPLS